MQVSRLVLIFLFLVLTDCASSSVYNPHTARSLASNRNSMHSEVLEQARFKEGVVIKGTQGFEAVAFAAGMAICADGAPNAYHPENKGIDYLANAGKPGNWWALVTHNGKADGEPVVQGPRDPFPGFYVSATALSDPSKPAVDPRRYVDSRIVPYIVLPKGHRQQIQLGDLGVVINLRNNLISPAIFADIGPSGKIGEGSIRLARNLGIKPDPKDGGAEEGIIYLVFPGSGDGKPIAANLIESKAMKLFETWGGLQRLSRLK